MLFDLAKFPKAKPFAPATDDELERLEFDIGMPIPREYREFLKQYNGCDVHATFDHPIHEEVMLGRLFPTYSEHKADLVDVVFDYDFFLRVNPAVRPIGDIGIGRLALAFSGPTLGAVYVWPYTDFAEVDEAEEFYDEMDDPIAFNFYEFWKLLRAKE